MLKLVVSFFIVVFSVGVVYAEPVQENNIPGAVQGADGKMYVPTMKGKYVVLLTEGEAVYFDRHCIQERSDFWHVQKVCKWSGGVKNEGGIIKKLSADFEVGKPAIPLEIILPFIGIVSMVIVMVTTLFTAATIIVSTAAAFITVVFIATFIATITAIALTIGTFAIAFTAAVTSTLVYRALVNENKEVARVWGGVYIALMVVAMFIA